MNKLALFLCCCFLSMSAHADRILYTFCEASSEDPYVFNSPVLMISYNISKATESIPLIEGEKIRWLAGENFGDEGGFEANGGVWSLALAGDLKNSLESLPFSSIETNGDESTYPIESPKKCNLSYPNLDYYESGAWQNE